MGVLILFIFTLSTVGAVGPEVCPQPEDPPAVHVADPGDIGDGDTEHDATSFWKEAAELPRWDPDTKNVVDLDGTVIGRMTTFKDRITVYCRHTGCSPGLIAEARAPSHRDVVLWFHARTNFPAGSAGRAAHFLNMWKGLKR